MRILFLAFFVLLNSSCSRTGIMMRFFDTLAVSKTDDYFDLTSEQKENLKKELQKDLENIRKEFFPTAAKTLRELAPLAEQEKLDQEEVLKRSLDVQNKMRTLLQYFRGTTLKTALTLEPRQFAYFSKEVRDEIEKESDPEEQQDQAFTRYRRSLEFWIGGISSLQKEKLKSFLKNNPYPGQLQNQSKLHVMEKFLSASKDRKELEKFLESFLNDYEQVRLPEFTQKINEHKVAFQKFFANELWPTLSKNQRQHLRENLLARAQELDEFSQRP